MRLLDARLSALTYRLCQESHAGIMIALVPSAEDAARLALGGDPADLHVTLCHWGDASAMPLDQRASLVSVLRDKAALFTPLLGKTFGVGVFNPTGDEPALVLNVGGEAVDTFRREVGYGGPDQHQPWAAHMTLAQPATVALPVTDEIAARMGPVVFDRVRIAFGNESVDIPFVTDPVATATASRVVYEAMQAGAEVTACRGAAAAAELTVSLSAAATVTIDGDQITFPVVAFVEGVRQPSGASKGPELFLASHFKQALASAVDMPVVFDHPKKGKQYVSINEAGPFNDGTGVRVGFLTNVRFEGDRMVADVVSWLSKMRSAGPAGSAVADALVAGERQVEVSIGHFAALRPVEGSFHGAAYRGIATNVVYDHLALLPIGVKGACSIDHGCGAPRS